MKSVMGGHEDSAFERRETFKSDVTLGSIKNPSNSSHRKAQLEVILENGSGSEFENAVKL